MKKIIERRCLNCNKILIIRHKIKYCSNKCQADKKHINCVNEWKNGIKSGNVGVQTKIISSFLRSYLLEKYKEKCSLCNWNKRNVTSGKIPLEVDHIDGNAENNSENNLRLLCPNCHSLTPHFRNLNKGKGRGWRIKKSKVLN